MRITSRSTRLTSRFFVEHLAALVGSCAGQSEITLEIEERSMAILRSLIGAIAIKINCKKDNLTECIRHIFSLLGDVASLRPVRTVGWFECAHSERVAYVVGNREDTLCRLCDERFEPVRKAITPCAVKPR
jgi:hypothetical protein